MENKKIKILAVDDIYDNLITLKALISEAFPYAEVLFALSGSEAISMAKRTKPDLILLDVVMPEMDGFEVCKALKADSQLVDIPVVFITALKGDKDSRIKGLEVGAEAFLAKPVDESELVAQIRAMSKIRDANLLRRLEQEKLSEMVSEKTMQLEQNNVATLNLLEDLQKEIVARRNTEAELLLSQAKLRKAELASKSGNWEFNHKTNQFHLSEGAAFVLGFSETNVDYSSFVDRIDVAERKSFELSLKQLITSSLPFNDEVRFLPVGESEAIDIRIFAVKEADDKQVFGILRNITENKIAREKLIESEMKFRELMDNSPEGITIYVDGKIAYVNKQAMNVMRAKHKRELLGKSLFEFIHPENVELIMERMQFVAITPLNVALPAVEEKYTRLDGTEVEVEIIVMPIIYEGKAAVQISGHDITEKKQAREEIEKNRRELKAIYDNAPVMMCVVNEKAEILFSNNALNTFIDNPNQLTNGNNACGNVFGCIHSFDNPSGCGYGTDCSSCALRHALVDTFETGLEHKNIDYQTIVVRGNEQKKVTMLASTSLIESEGEKRLLLCMNDISVRREAQEALLKSEEKFRLITENISDGIIAFGDHNNIIYVSPSYLKQTGYQKEIALSFTIDDINSKIHPEDNERIMSQIYTAIGDKAQELTYTYRTTKATGEYYWREDTASFKYDVKGEYTGAYVICRDISDMLKYQKELLDYQTQLKDFAAHLQTVREEERVDLAREIHDDLGQVLVAIKFDLGMLGVKSKKFVRDEAVDEFSKQFKRLEGYVNNSIKSARRIMTDLRPELLDMVGLVEAFKEHIAAFNERQSIKCVFINHTEGVDLPPEKAVALFRILQESLNNASKYSEATNLTVELGFRDNSIYLEIIDDGVGFDLAIKKRSDSYGLTGMKERAYLLDGTVDIWSEIGKGVKICVKIPES